MNVQLNIDYGKLLELVLQLPENQIVKFKKDLDEKLNTHSKSSDSEQELKNIHPDVLELWGAVPYSDIQKSDKEILGDALLEKYMK